MMYLVFYVKIRKIKMIPLLGGHSRASSLQSGHHENWGHFHLPQFWLMAKKYVLLQGLRWKILMKKVVEL